MMSSQILKYLLLMALLGLLCERAMTQYDAGFHGPERNALVALRDEFNSSFLNHNWTSIMCYLNNTPNWYGIQCLNGRVTGLLLENMGLIGAVKSDALVNLTELSILSFKNNSISGNVMDFSNNSKLRQINLSGNKFGGQVSSSLMALNFLESLQLQENTLNGSIPSLNQTGLKEFNVSNNDLSGEIPNTKVLQAFNYSSYAGNKDLCGPPCPTACSIRNDDPSNPKGDDASNSKGDDSSNSSKSTIAALLIVVDIVGLVVLVFLFIIYYKKSKKLEKALKKLNLGVKDEEEAEIIHVEKIEIGDQKREIEGGHQEIKKKLIFVEEANEGLFELGDLLKASAEGLGQGNFGNCYKAMLDGGPAIVVKRLRDLRPLSNEEFVGQVQMIASQKHPSLLPLIAYFNSNDEKLLVYKYASRGNLYNRIHGARETKDRIPLRWSSRLAVARVVAQALEYLHKDTSPRATVPHGNLKSTNVLLDDNDAVLVADHGFISIVSLPIAAQRMVSFKSPEYEIHKKLSKRSDVWSYGCLLLELLTGRIPSQIGAQCANAVDLCSWVHRAVREEWTAEIFDVEIAVQRSAGQGMLRLLQIAMRCCDKSPETRPEMAEVVREVENIKVAVDSEDEGDFSMDRSRSLTDDSASATPSLISNGSTSR